MVLNIYKSSAVRLLVETVLFILYAGTSEKNFTSIEEAKSADIKT